MLLNMSHPRLFPSRQQVLLEGEADFACTGATVLSYSISNGADLATDGEVK